MSYSPHYKVTGLVPQTDSAPGRFHDSERLVSLALFIPNT